MERIKREHIWAIGALVIAILLAYILINIARDDASPQTQVCVSSEDKDRIRALELEAYDDAFHDHIAKLYGIWLTDPGDQPRRARVGNDSAIRAYLHARKLAMDWDPPAC